MKYLFTTLLLLSTIIMSGQSVGINNTGSQPDPSSILDIQSDSKGLLIPRLTDSEMNNIPNASEGLLIYNTTKNKFYYFNSFWQPVSPAFAKRLQDSDLDTAIEVERTTDGDSIYMRVEGYDFMKLDGTTMHLGNKEGSLYIGKYAGDGDNGGAHQNTGIGYMALRNDTTGFNNTALGYKALSGSDAGDSNVAIGVRSMEKTKFGDFNVAVGNNSMLNNISGARNVALGARSMFENTNGKSNVSIGYHSMYDNTTGSSNIAIGDSALANNQVTSFNTAIGQKSIHSINSGYFNVGLGTETLSKLEDGFSNVAIGDLALSKVDLSYGNVAVGASALGESLNCLSATAIGATAGENVSGWNNVLVGASSGRNLQGNNNLLLGNQAGHDVQGDFNVLIGDQAGRTLVGSNKLYIENSQSPTPLIYGDFASDIVRVNGKFEIASEYSLPTQSSGKTNATLLAGNPGEELVWTPFALPDVLGNTGDVMILSAAGTLVWQAANDGDGDTNDTNELQNLLLNGNELSITDGTTVTLPDTEGPWTTLPSNSTYYNGAVGINTSNPNVASLQIDMVQGRTGQFISNDEMGNGNFVGSEIIMTGTGSASKFGYSSSIDATNSQLAYGISSFITGASSTNDRAIYAKVTGDGTAIEADGVGGRAALFRGKTDMLGPVSIGTEEIEGILTVQNPNSQDTMARMILRPTGSNKSSAFMLNEDLNSNFGMEIRYNGGINELQIVPKDQNYLQPTFRMKRNTGEVAFGNTFATGYQMSVSGEIMCEGVTVEMQSNWPDYVFTDEYRLMPLQEVKDFINQHHHLPNIPSAQEIESEGLDLARMQTSMMEKIEELTLHIINLSEVNQKLQKTVNELQKAQKNVD